MAKLLFENKHSSMTIAFAAICAVDGRIGDWHDEHDDAVDDARNHRKIPGNRDHVINIATRQVSHMLFMPDDEAEF